MILPLCEGTGTEGAVAAHGRAEGDPHVEAVAVPAVQPVQKAFIDRPGSQKRSRDISHDGHHRKGQHLGQRPGHLKDQDDPGERRPHHRREISRHGQQDEIIEEHRVQPPQADPSHGEDPAHIASQYQQGEEDPARRPGPEAYRGKQESSHQKEHRRSQQHIHTGQLLDQIVAAAQKFRRRKAQNPCAEEGDQDEGEGRDESQHGRHHHVGHDHQHSEPMHILWLVLYSWVDGVIQDEYLQTLVKRELKTFEASTGK